MHVLVYICLCTEWALSSKKKTHMTPVETTTERVGGGGECSARRHRNEISYDSIESLSERHVIACRSGLGLALCFTGFASGPQYLRVNCPGWGL